MCPGHPDFHFVPKCLKLHLNMCQECFDEKLNLRNEIYCHLVTSWAGRASAWTEESAGELNLSVLCWARVEALNTL